MEAVNYIAMAIPVFFALIGIEWVVSWWQKRKLYRLNDAINDLQCGILQQVLGVFTKTLVFSAYVAIYQNARILDIDPIWWVWALCFLGVDFLYYWFHRVSHESNLPWGAHIVHHSSEEYNLAVALRQGSFQHLFSWVFYLPLAWVGFSPVVFLTCQSFNTLYQFWIHTRAIGTLGPVEWVFNTPSHHRVHHGCDSKYIDKNYAGTLIIWDRLFGSFQQEEEEPTYGITKPLSSWNPLWANLHYYVDLWTLSRKAPNWREALKVWIKPPAWAPDWAPQDSSLPTPLTHGEAGKYNASLPMTLVPYLVIHFLGLIAMTVLLLFKNDTISPLGTAALGLLAAWTATNLGTLFEGRRWVLPSEIARLAVLTLSSIALAGGRWMGLVVIVAAASFALFAAWLLRERDHFQEATGDSI